jgi:hypothetical protein
LIGAGGQRGASLHFNTRQLPCFTLWKNTPPVEDGYVTGLEPGTNFPNPRSFEGERGRVVKLAAGESARFDLVMNYLSDATSVAAEEAAIAALQGSQEPVVHADPIAEWCAG